MALFPSYEEINYGNPVNIDIQFKTISSNFDDLGVEHRKRKWLYPKRTITLQYNFLSLTDARTIFQFYLDRSGSYEAFTFFIHDNDSYQREYIGTGDGSTLTYNLPCKNSVNRSVYLSNVLQTESTHYNYSPLGGTDGCDEITFISAPASGHRIILNFLGNLKIKCKFKEDNMGFNTFYNKFRSFGIELSGLLNY